MEYSEKPEIIDQLSRSEEYQDFERAFCGTTQLSLRLRSLGSRDPAGDGEGQQAQLMNVKAVPVRLGDKTIGVLELGLPDQERTETEFFEGRPEQIRNPGANNDLESIDHAYLHPIVSDRARYKAMGNRRPDFGEAY